MDVIALMGESNVGKTQTLNILYSLLLANDYTQVLGHFQDHKNNDFMDILEKGGVRIGIATQGDYSRELPKYLSYLSNNGCIKAVCACTTDKKGTINAVNAYRNIPIPPKSKESNDFLQRIVNTNDALHILTEILK